MLNPTKLIKQANQTSNAQKKEKWGQFCLISKLWALENIGDSSVQLVNFELQVRNLGDSSAYLINFK